jgi:hypothetical protein
MTWKYYPLSDGDPKAKKQFFENFRMSSQKHVLTKALSERFSGAIGPIFAIAHEALDLDKITDYRWAGTYAGGKQWYEAAGTYTIAVGNRSIDGLVQFLRAFLQSSEDAIVLCDNWSDERNALVHRTVALESHLLFHGQDIYHVLIRKDTNPDFIEQTIREADNTWLTGVCSICKEVPQGEILSEAFFDEIVANAVHIFVPALDGEGFLVWTEKGDATRY